ncbi:MAG: DUF6603 domain-containing protein [Rhizomicrobium sp.]
MSFGFCFSVHLCVGDVAVPLLSELVADTADAADGTSAGFLFRLDLKHTCGPLQFNLGDLIGLVEQQLGAGVGSLRNAPGIGDIASAFSDFLDAEAFTSDNALLVQVKAFEISSSATKKLFNISVEVESADPTQGAIPLPAPLVRWLAIDNLAIAFKATDTVAGGAATAVNLQVGLNALLAGVPVALAATVDKTGDGSTFTFDGSVQSAIVPLGEFLALVASQFGVTVQLPPELNLDAAIDYVVGQVVHTAPSSGTSSTQFGAAAKFGLTVDGNGYTMICFAATAPAAPSDTSGLFAVGATFAPSEGALRLSSLPLVGDVPGFGQLTLDRLGFTYSSVPVGGTPVAFAIPQVAAASNPLYTRSDASAPEASTYAIIGGTTLGAPGAGFSLTASLLDPSGNPLGTFALPLSLPAATPPADPALPVPYSATNTSSPASPVHWIRIGKSFGPVTLQQIGLDYDASGRATFGLVAAFALGGFSLDLDGLTVVFPLPLPGASVGSDLSVAFGLQGLSLGFASGPLSIAGGFLRATGAEPGYFGEVSVQVANFGLRAMGGYVPGPPASFFLYGMVDVPLGGPPFLFVTGLAAGFGVNTALVAPTLATLSGYFLLPQNAPLPGATPAATMTTLLPQLQSNFPPQAGAYWVAAGVQFTSFEMIEGFAALTVAFGVDLQFGLIGSCAMSLPLGEPAAYIEIDMAASFGATSGQLSVQGKLSPASYLFGSFCRPTGGFAFNIWTSGANAGHCVVTVGGYNPGFTPPDGYPAVPRLAINFGLGAFQVTGSAYFALLPAMMMGGVAMSATWNSGAVKAWFNAGADFLIAWSPLSYQADAYVALGCALNLGLHTLKVQVGADLQIWGPSFGGQAHVHLDVVSFTVAFGSSAPAQAPPLAWSGFKSSFLPTGSSSPRTGLLRTGRSAATDDTPTTDAGVVLASVPSGLIASGQTAADGTVYDWILDPDTFSLLTSSAVPANCAEWTTNPTAGTVYVIPNTVTSYNVAPAAGDPYLSLPAGTPTYGGVDQDHPDAVWCPDLAIAPMHLNSIQSFHTVTLMTAAGVPVTSVSVQPMLMASSAALWAPDKGAGRQPNDPPMVPFALTGFLISPIPQTPDTLSAIPVSDLLFREDPPQTGFTDGSAAVSTDYEVVGRVSGPPGAASLSIAVSGSASEQLPNVDHVLSSLADSWVAQQRTAILDDLTSNGFATWASAAVDVTAMSTTTALWDWPAVGLLGSI